MVHRSIALNEHLAGAKFNSTAAKGTRSLFHILTVS